MARILVTGAGGFIGRALCPALAARGHRIVAGLRRAPAAGAADDRIEPQVLGDIAPGREWQDEVAGVEVVVHLAQRAHRRASGRDVAGEPQAAAGLARAAAKAGARRLIYLSSIKAMGEATAPGRPFRPDDAPRPEDAYGRAKLATERALAQAAGETGLGLAVLRPPLVYGPEVGGNFAALLRLAASGLPLPFAGVENRRSLIFVGNLVDLIAVSSEHPAAVGGTWLASDGADLATPDLIRLLAAARGRSARLFGLPDPALRMLRVLPLLGPRFGRLTSSLQVDDTATRAALGWRAPVAAEDALRMTARAFATRAPDPGAGRGVC